MAHIVQAFHPHNHIIIMYFEGMVNRIYPPELQLNKANTSDTEAPFLDLHLPVSNRFVSS